MATTRAILLKDLQGIKFEDGTKPILKRFVAATSHSTLSVPRGELLLEAQPNPQFNYVLSHDTNVSLKCNDGDVSPLNDEEFLLLKAIKDPHLRLEAFHNKLEWGIKLKRGDIASIAIQGAGRSSVEQCVVKGQVEPEHQSGIYFKVQIMVNEGGCFD